jgi:hypothetical protein
VSSPRILRSWGGAGRHTSAGSERAGGTERSRQEGALAGVDVGRSPAEGGGEFAEGGRGGSAREAATRFSQLFFLMPCFHAR